MCTYQTLYWNQDSGYVFRCSECRHMQIAFGCMLLTFDEAVYPDFCRLIHTISQECGDITNLALKQIRIPLPYEGIFLLLSKREVDQLMEMLDLADSEWRSLSMLQLFQAEKDGPRNGWTGFPDLFLNASEETLVFLCGYINRVPRRDG